MRAIVGVLSLTFVSVAHASPVFEEVAREGSASIATIDDRTAPVIADDGTVAFFTKFDADTIETLSRVDAAGTLTRSWVLSEPLRYAHSLVADALGGVAFVSYRQIAGVPWYGVHRIDNEGRLQTVYQTEGEELDGRVVSNVALAPNGTLAFSTHARSDGALHRMIPGGSLESWPVSLDFANSRQLDVNDAGQLAVDLEYVDPRAGLTHGVFVIERALQGLRESQSAIDALPTDQAIGVSWNAARQSAFAITRETPLPENWFVPGVFVADPTPFGEAKSAISTTAGSAYARFGKVLIDDASGHVVFEAEFADGRQGIFTDRGPVVVSGNVVDGVTVREIALGGLNRSGQISFRARGFDAGRQRIFRASCIFDGSGARRIDGPVEVRSAADAEALRCVDAIDGDLRIDATTAPEWVELPNLNEVTGDVTVALPLRPRVPSDSPPSCGAASSDSSQRQLDLRLIRIGGSLSVHVPNTLADPWRAQPVDLGFPILQTIGGDLALDFSTAAIACGFDQLSSVGGDLHLHGLSDLTASDLFWSLNVVTGDVTISGTHTTTDLLGRLREAGSVTLEADERSTPMVVLGDSLHNLQTVARDLELAHVQWPTSQQPLRDLVSVGGTLRLRRVAYFTLDDLAGVKRPVVRGLDVDSTSFACITAERSSGCMPFKSASLLRVLPRSKYASIRFYANPALPRAQVCEFIERQRAEGFMGSVSAGLCGLTRP